MKWINNHIKSIFDEVRETLPGTHCLSFSITRFRDIPDGETWFNNYIHFDGKCKEFKSIDELKTIISEAGD